MHIKVTILTRSRFKPIEIILKNQDVNNMLTKCTAKSFICVPYLCIETTLESVYLILPIQYYIQ